MSFGKRIRYECVQTNTFWGEPEVSRELSGTQWCLHLYKFAKYTPTFIIPLCRSGKGNRHILNCSNTLLPPDPAGAPGQGVHSPRGTEPSLAKTHRRTQLRRALCDDKPQQLRKAASEHVHTHTCTCTISGY